MTVTFSAALEGVSPTLDVPTLPTDCPKLLPSCVFRKLSGGKMGLGVGWTIGGTAGKGDADDPDDVEVLRDLDDPPLL